jgi:hypothetical protein
MGSNRSSGRYTGTGHLVITKESFPEVAETSPQLRKTVLERFGRSFFGLR